MMTVPEATEDAHALSGYDAGEVSQARRTAAQLLDRFRRIRSDNALEAAAGRVPPTEGEDGDG